MPHRASIRLDTDVYDLLWEHAGPRGIHDLIRESILEALESGREVSEPQLKLLRFNVPEEILNQIDVVT